MIALDEEIAGRADSADLRLVAAASLQHQADTQSSFLAPIRSFRARSILAAEYPPRWAGSLGRLAAFSDRGVGRPFGYIGRSWVSSAELADGKFSCSDVARLIMVSPSLGHRGVLLVADFAFAPSDSQLGRATATCCGPLQAGWDDAVQALCCR